MHFLTLLLGFFLLLSNLVTCSLPNFDYTNRDHHGLEPTIPHLQNYDLAAAFDEVIKIARLVSVNLKIWEQEFTVYFRITDGDFVRNVFLTIANLPLGKVPQYGGDLNQFVNDLSGPRNPKFEQLTIALNDNEKTKPHTPNCFDKRTWHAYFGQDLENDGDKGFMSVCTWAWTFPTLHQIEVIPDWAKDPNTGKIKDGYHYGCNNILDHASSYMMSISGVILHELLHWPYLFRDIPDYQKYIKPASDGQRKIGDWPGPDPKDGKGPWNAWKLNRVNPSQGGAALNNADNYVYYALVKWWGWKCNRQWSVPESIADNFRRAFPDYE